MLLGPKAVGLLTIGALLLVAAGCGRSDSADPTPASVPPGSSIAPPPTPTPVNPETALRRSGEVMKGLEAFHFRLHHEKGGLELLPGTIIREVEGDVVKPDGLSVSFSGSVGTGFAIKASLIALGDEGYMTDPLTGKWTAGPPGVSALGFFDPSRGIEAMMSEVVQPILLSVDEDNGPAFTLAGRLAAEVLAPLVGTTLEGSIVQVELTIHAERFQLLEARFAGVVTPTDTADTVRVITLSGFGEPISIKAPI